MKKDNNFAKEVREFAKKRKITDKQRIECMKMIEEMATVNDPWNLLEPYLYKDKIGDSLWHCEIRTCDGILILDDGLTPYEAVKKVYDIMKKR
jgi:hypothetical protein